LKVVHREIHSALCIELVLCWLNWGISSEDKMFILALFFQVVLVCVQPGRVATVGGGWKQAKRGWTTANENVSSAAD